MRNPDEKVLEHYRDVIRASVTDLDEITVEDAQVVEAVALYLAEHEFDEPTEAVLYQLYHFTRWQRITYGIWTTGWTAKPDEYYYAGKARQNPTF